MGILGAREQAQDPKPQKQNQQQKLRPMALTMPIWHTFHLPMSPSGGGTCRASTRRWWNRWNQIPGASRRMFRWHGIPSERGFRPELPSKQNRIGQSPHWKTGLIPVNTGGLQPVFVDNWERVVASRAHSISIFFSSPAPWGSLGWSNPHLSPPRRNPVAIWCKW